MNLVKRTVRDLEKKYKERIKRARVVAQLAPELNRAEVKAMVDDQVEDIRGWTRDAVIKEFCDPEELIMRGILKRFGSD